jgi:hypothetical protein
MSYDLYCYKSQLGRPDLEEAQAAIEVDEDNEVEAEPETKLKIAMALIDYNPALESFEFDYEEIARLQGTSVEEAKEKFDHIELNTPEGGLATQITIFDNNVSITVPYWYSGDKAEEVFKKITAYTKIIRQIAGYFVYDPQTENAYDPLTQDFDGLTIYQSMTEVVEQRINEQTESVRKKPWWKFW